MPHPNCRQDDSNETFDETVESVHDSGSLVSRPLTPKTYTDPREGESTAHTLTVRTRAASGCLGENVDEACWSPSTLGSLRLVYHHPVVTLARPSVEGLKLAKRAQRNPYASSSNEAVHLQQRLRSLSTELVTLRNRLHVNQPAAHATSTAPAPAPAAVTVQQPAVPPRSAVNATPHPNSADTIISTKCRLSEKKHLHHHHQQQQQQQPVQTDPLPPTAVTLKSAVQKNEQPKQQQQQQQVAMRAVGCAELEDLIHLPGPLTEDAVLKCLQARFCASHFFTNVGPILLSVNPYHDVGNPLTLTSTRGVALSPKLLKVVQEAVRQQSETGYPQAIILSGTSGSGKTYASMLLLRQLFDVAGGGPETDAFKHLAAAFTVLRSLGSAKTATNSESSRIGHFIEVQVTDGALYRTKIHCYFLDQTRVIRPLPNEKNYHIFYQMLAGLTQDERVKLNLEGYSPHNLKYLQCGDTKAR
uniref:Myosin motor domain-containing protein n=1 Tax=Timema cristinae TaxID=61476 RepID=A0A7R9CD95_TIMCR|nr:unnamed protein product [Timema cristinae]